MLKTVAREYDVGFVDRQIKTVTEDEAVSGRRVGGGPEGPLGELVRAAIESEHDEAVRRLLSGQADTSRSAPPLGSTQEARTAEPLSDGMNASTGEAESAVPPPTIALHAVTSAVVMSGCARLPDGAPAPLAVACISSDGSVGPAHAVPYAAEASNFETNERIGPAVTPTEPVAPDGPCEGNRFRFDGNVCTFGKSSDRARLVGFVWKQRRKGRKWGGRVYSETTITVTMEAVYGHDHNKTDAAFKKLVLGTKDVFLAAKPRPIRLRLSVSFATGKLILEEPAA
ncbi:MAG: hypothetical protein U0871_11975 [Gemmataceae bacterium]